MKLPIAMATLLLTAAVAGQNAHVVPFGPTTATPIEVHYLTACTAKGGHSVTREGTTIRITALDPQCVLVLPIPFVEKVKLPDLLPYGEYTVEIRREGDPGYLDGAGFVVRNAAPKPFELHPTVLPHGSDFPIRLSGVTCVAADCSDVTVRVDGEPVLSQTVASDGAIWFVPAPETQNRGFHDVTVQKSDFVMVAPGALYAHAAATPDLYERILFPVLFNADGAFGSRWRSELTVSNPRPWWVNTVTPLELLEPCDGDGCETVLPPKHFRRYEGHQNMQGRLLWAPRPEADDLAIALRVRDLSRQTEGYGTEVPVVRERDFIHGANIRLLDVPFDPRYRVKVRIYMVDPFLPSSKTGAVIITRGDTRLQLPFTLTRAQERQRLPYYAEVDLPQGVVRERLPIEIAMPLDATGWAFASVTNNETQQVTIVAPY